MEGEDEIIRAIVSVAQNRRLKIVCVSIKLYPDHRKTLIFLSLHPIKEKMLLSHVISNKRSRIVVSVSIRALYL